MWPPPRPWASLLILAIVGVIGSVFDELGVPPTEEATPPGKFAVVRLTVFSVLILCLGDEPDPPTPPPPA